MKKLICLIFTSLLLLGCNKKVDFNTLLKELDNTNMFTNNTLLTNDEIEYKFSIDAQKSTEDFIYYNETKNNSNVVFVIKDNELFNNLVKHFESTWLDNVYNEQEALKVRKALKTKYNGYNIYIVSDENNSDILNIIKGNI